MPSPHRTRLTRIRTVITAAAVLLALAGTPDPASASTPDARSVGTSPPEGIALRTGTRAATYSGASTAASTNGQPRRWTWPVSAPRDVIRGFEAPASRYSAGHRGIDIRADMGVPVLSPEAGTVKFAGVVVDRATVTIETADGILISIEPVTTALTAGESVTGGAAFGTTSAGGHCSARCIHLGVRVHGDYVSPMLFFGGVPRAVLLPLR